MFEALRMPALAAVAALSAATLMLPAAAQSTAPAQQTPPSAQSAAPANVTDEKLDSFVVAARELGEINARYSPQLQQADDAAQQDKIRQEASGKMVEAIRESGLTVEEYNQIYALTRTDAEIAGKVERKLEAAQ